MCICCLSCCCRNSTMKYISQAFLLLTLVSFLLAIVICIIPAANVKRYDMAKQYLEAFENNQNPVIDINDLRNLQSYSTRLPLEKKIKLPRSEIRYTSIYKKWKTIELTINILGVILIIPLLVANILIWTIKRNYNGDITDNSLVKKQQNLSILSLTLLIILIVFCLIASYLRTMASICDEDIGLYDENKENVFQNRIIYADFCQTIQLILFSCSICLAYKLYYNAKYYNGRNKNVQPTNNVVAITNIQPIPVNVVDGQYVYAQNAVPYVIVASPQNMNFNNRNNNIENNNIDMRSNRTNMRNLGDDVNNFNEK